MLDRTIMPEAQPSPPKGLCSAYTPAPATLATTSCARTVPAAWHARRIRPGRAAGAGAAAAAVWVGMTGPGHWADPSGWIIGAVAVGVVAAMAGAPPRALLRTGAVGAAPVPADAEMEGDVRAGPMRAERATAGPRQRLSVAGTLRLAVWFAAQALRGAVDVARRALDPALPVAPGWYRHPLRLPPGAPRLVMANAITLLPGTLTAELVERDGDDHLILHLLDARIDPGPDLEALEARVRGLFTLPAPPPAPPPVQASPIPAPVQTPTLLALPRPKDTP